MDDDEWKRLKEAYADFAVDAARTVDALLIRAGVVLDVAERFAPGQVREFRQALEFAAADIDDRFAAFERRLNAFRPGWSASVVGQVRATTAAAAPIAKVSAQYPMLPRRAARPHAPLFGSLGSSPV